MVEIKSKVADLYKLRALIVGFRSSMPVKRADGTEEIVDSIVLRGFANEAGVTEGTRRIANKIAKKILEELTTIDEQRKQIAENKYEGASLTAEEIEADKKRLDDELLDDEVTFSVDELVDFNKVADMSLSDNYSELYEKIFKNY